MEGDDQAWKYLLRYLSETEKSYDIITGRKYRLGDSVVSNMGGQVGQVVEIKRYFGLHDGDGIEFESVSSKLQRITKFATGDFVALDQWLGRVLGVGYEVVVRFHEDGKPQVFKWYELFCLSPLDPSWNLSSSRHCPFFPGQQVRTYDETGTVDTVTDSAVFVEWIASTNSEICNSFAPDDVQDADSVKLVDFSSLACWKVGDVCRHDSSLSHCLLIDLRTLVDVYWDDGTIQKDLESTKLTVIELEDHDFIVDQYVLKRGTNIHDYTGVVKAVNRRKRTVEVKWFDAQNEELSVETISSYHLKPHPSFNHRIGSIVYRLAANEFEISKMAWVGIVAAFENGKTNVKWADGTTSMVPPQAIKSVSRGDQQYLKREGEFEALSRAKECEIDALFQALTLHKIEGADTKIPEESEVEDGSSAEITKGQVDLLDLVDLPSVRCLNQSCSHTIFNALKQGYREDESLNLESVEDEQLLIYIPFTQTVRLHAILIKGPEEEGPKTLKLYSNKENLGFSDVNNPFPPTDTAILSEDNLKGKPVLLKRARFQNVHSVTIFIEDNQSGSELTRVREIVLYGTRVQQI